MKRPSVMLCLTIPVRPQSKSQHHPPDMRMNGRLQGSSPRFPVFPPRFQELMEQSQAVFTVPCLNSWPTKIVREKKVFPLFEVTNFRGNLWYRQSNWNIALNCYSRAKISSQQLSVPPLSWPALVHGQLEFAMKEILPELFLVQLHWGNYFH